MKPWEVERENLLCLDKGYGLVKRQVRKKMFIIIIIFFNQAMDRELLVA